MTSTVTPIRRERASVRIVHLILGAIGDAPVAQFLLRADRAEAELARLMVLARSELVLLHHDQAAAEVLDRLEIAIADRDERLVGLQASDVDVVAEIIEGTRDAMADLRASATAAIAAVEPATFVEDGLRYAIGADLGESREVLVSDRGARSWITGDELGERRAKLEAGYTFAKQAGLTDARRSDRGTVRAVMMVEVHEDDPNPVRVALARLLLVAVSNCPCCAPERGPITMIELPCATCNLPATWRRELPELAGDAPRPAS
jgi:hypothetical protein